MYSKLAIFSVALCAVIANARPNEPTVTVTETVTPPAQTVVSQCNTGSIQCCNTVGEANSSEVLEALGVLNVLAGLLDGITGIVGLGCTPLSVVGIGSGVNCDQQPVCCTGVVQNGLINTGCSPITL